ncbi:uncharacterized protein [Watersipora subatra]|uniref:uncharacterized protein n=1 Tax=Watersipora subatra TaxID=2589382 RepID=UPI00355B0C0F
MADNCGVFVILVFPISNYQRFKNAMMKNRSILLNYTGSLVCSAPETRTIEGNWPGNRTIAILHFTSEISARSYLQSDPVVKQPDFMDGVDVCIVPLNALPPTGKEFFVIADVQVHDPEKFLNEYSPKTSEMKAKGEVVVTAASTNLISYRGSWKPSMLIINQWPDEASYHTFYNSDAYQPLKELRRRITRSTVVTLRNELTN